MKIFPWNRRLLVTIEDNSSGEPTILVPEDYNPKANEYLIAKVDAVSEDGNHKLLGKRVVLSPNGVEEVNISGSTYYLVLENYVVCMAEED